jgi:nicotinate-nucleotide adenylyltransferase
MRSGLLGGTFDPPHLGHLVLAEAALTQLGVEAVVFVPAGDPWQKPDDITDAEDRLQMTRLAVDGIDGMRVDDREVRRAGPSYTADTVREWQQEGTTPVLVLGADTAAGLTTWHDPHVLAEIDLAVAPRPGTDRATVEAAVGRTVTWLDAPEIVLSSTELRRRFAAGLSNRFLVPDPVRDHVRDHHLYR